MQQIHKAKKKSNDYPTKGKKKKKNIFHFQLLRYSHQKEQTFYDSRI